MTPVGAVTVDKFKGALLGCAVGDALGAHVEVATPSFSKRCDGRAAETAHPVPAVGALSERTRFAVALAQAVIEMGRFSRENAAFKFGRLMERSDTSGGRPGVTCESCAAACRRIYRGVDLDETGRPSHCSCPAVRAIPLGLRYYDDPGALKESAVIQAGLTSTLSAAAAGAVVVAYVVSRCLGSARAIDRAALLSEAAQFVSDIDPGLADRIRGLDRFIDSDPELAFSYTGGTGETPDAVPGALYAFLRTPDDFEGTLVTAVRRGVDPGSVGAVAGAMSGALNACGSIPARLLDGLEGRDYIENLAERLFTLTPASRPGGRLRT